MTACVYPGHVVGGDSLRPEHAKVEVIRSMPLPLTNIVVSFFGLTGYYRTFIAGSCAVTLRLTDLTKRDLTKLEWMSECSRPFHQMKKLLCSNPVLLSPNIDKEFVLQTNTSN